MDAGATPMGKSGEFILPAAKFNQTEEFYDKDWEQQSVNSMAQQS